MALPGFLAVGSALGAYLLAKVRAGGGAAKRRRVDPLGAFVDSTEVPATPASSGDGAPRALANLRVRGEGHLPDRGPGHGFRLARVGGDAQARGQDRASGRDARGRRRDVRRGDAHGRVRVRRLRRERALRDTAKPGRAGAHPGGLVQRLGGRGRGRAEGRGLRARDGLRGERAGARRALRRLRLPADARRGFGDGRRSVRAEHGHRGVVRARRGDVARGGRRLAGAEARETRG